jgi:hypothetical protein
MRIESENFRGTVGYREADSSPSLRRSPALGPRPAGWFARDKVRVAGSASQGSQDAARCVPGRLPSFVPKASLQSRGNFFSALHRIPNAALHEPQLLPQRLLQISDQIIGILQSN